MLLLKHNPLLLKRLLVGKAKLFFMSDNVTDNFTQIGEFIYDLNFDFSVTKRTIKEKKLGYYEMAIVNLMQEALKPGDTFVDVGANVGYLTAIAMGCVGREGNIHAFEPISLYARYIEKYVLQNKLNNIKINQVALSNYEGTAEINVSKPPFTGNSGFVRVPQCDYLYQGVINVPMKRLDLYIDANQITKEKIKLIKIDVEGYEIPVLLGLENYFKSTSHRPIIICEIRANLYSALGCKLSELISYLSSYGYEAYNIYAPNRKLNLAEHTTSELNVVFKLPLLENY